MKNLFILHTLLLCLFLSARIAPAQVLEKRVTLHIQSVPLETALKKIKALYGVNFSYSPDQINVTKIVSLDVTNVTLDQALTKLFRDTPITYKAVGNQIVLKKGKVMPPTSAAVKTPAAVASISTDSVPEKTPLVKDTVAEQLALPVKPLEVQSSDSAQALQELDYSYEKELTALKQEYKHKKDSLKTDYPWYQLRLKENWTEAKRLLTQEYKWMRDSIMYFKKQQDIQQDSIETTYGEMDLIPAEFQFTGIYPLGTHHTNSRLYRNNYSINLLNGYNGAVDGVEFGCISNVIAREVKGAQFAGVVNVVGGYTRGVQMAGVVNVNQQELIGGQFAGVVNVNGGDSYGVQAAGVANVTRGNAEGAQLACINAHNGTVQGAQIGLINYAHKVKGVQLGFINVCDTIKGLPIGFLSVAKNGYSRFELYYSETTQANLAIKTGVKAFYNVFQFGTTTLPDYYRWTFGYGFGTNVQLGKRAALNIDLIAMHINENEAFTDKVNEQAQLRLTLGAGITNRIYVFAGPTFNAMFSEFVNTDGSIGSSMVPNNSIVYEHTFTVDNTKIYNPYWIGFNAGIRF